MINCKNLSSPFLLYLSVDYILLTILVEEIEAYPYLYKGRTFILLFLDIRLIRIYLCKKFLAAKIKINVFFRTEFFQGKRTLYLNFSFSRIVINMCSGLMPCIPLCLDSLFLTLCRNFLYQDLILISTNNTLLFFKLSLKKIHLRRPYKACNKRIARVRNKHSMVYLTCCTIHPS